MNAYSMVRRYYKVSYFAYLKDNVQSISAAAVSPVFNNAMARLAGSTALAGSQRMPLV